MHRFDQRPAEAALPRRWPTAMEAADMSAGIGFSNVLLLPHGTPNSAAWDDTQRPTRMNLSLDAG